MARKHTLRKNKKINFVGIDLGTSQSAIAAANGKRASVLSYVGWPKDFVSERALGQHIFFGEDALENRLSLEMSRPLEHGVIKKGNKRDEEAVHELIGFLLEQVGLGKEDAVHAVIGVPAEAMRVNKQAIIDAAADQCESLILVSEPFAAAYGRNVLNDAMVIDIGAGTVDLCIMHGSVPDARDQRTITKAGDFIDQKLYALITKKYPKANVTLNMAREFKEAASFVGKPPEKIEVELLVGGRPTMHDITSEVGVACESILPDLIEAAMELLGRSDPEFHWLVRQNIILAGGGSRIRGLDRYLESVLKEDGPCEVKCIPDPFYAGADGALLLAQDMPVEAWRSARQNEELV